MERSRCLRPGACHISARATSTDLRKAPGGSLRHFGYSDFPEPPFLREFSLWLRRPWTDTTGSARRLRLHVVFRDVVVYHLFRDRIFPAVRRYLKLGALTIGAG